MFSLNKYKFIIFSIIFLTIAFVLSSCYSFTGGAIPPHLKSLFILTIEDNSGYGYPRFRTEMNTKVLEVFRNDNSFTLANYGGDAKLEVVITSISDQTVSLQQGELESERRLTISVKAVYYDNVKDVEIWNKTFSKYQNYDISNPQVNRDNAGNLVIEQLSNDILIAVVSGW